MKKSTPHIPRLYRGPTQFRKKGLLIIYTGEGKGKTSAAMGAVFRSLGRGMKVGIVQFMKGTWVSGEVRALDKFKDQCDYYAVGEGFTWETKSLAKDKKLAKKGWDLCRKLLNKKKYHLLLLDELLYVLRYRLLKVQDVVYCLKRRKMGVHVILTGRGIPPSLMKLADIVTEMRDRQHAFHKGILAQPGIDY